MNILAILQRILAYRKEAPHERHWIHLLPLHSAQNLSYIWYAGTIIDHGYEVNSLGAQKIVIVSPVDTLLQREYGKEITIKSDAVFDYFKNGQEAYLPFTENPEYDPELLQSEKVVIWNDLLGI